MYNVACLTHFTLYILHCTFILQLGLSEQPFYRTSILFLDIRFILPIYALLKLT